MSRKLVKNELSAGNNPPERERSESPELLIIKEVPAKTRATNAPTPRRVKSEHEHSISHASHIAQDLVEKSSLRSPIALSPHLLRPSPITPRSKASTTSAVLPSTMIPSTSMGGREIATTNTNDMVLKSVNPSKSPQKSRVAPNLNAAGLSRPAAIQRNLPTTSSVANKKVNSNPPNLHNISRTSHRLSDAPIIYQPNAHNMVNSITPNSQNPNHNLHRSNAKPGVNKIAGGLQFAPLTASFINARAPTKPGPAKNSEGQQVDLEKLREYKKELQRITLPLDTLLKLVNLPQFGQVVTGCFVRLKVPENGLAQILYAVDAVKPMEVKGVKFNKKLQLIRGQKLNEQRDFSLIENSTHILVEELSLWMKTNKEYLPSIAGIDAKEEQVAFAFSLTHISPSQDYGLFSMENKVRHLCDFAPSFLTQSSILNLMDAKVENFTELVSGCYVRMRRRNKFKEREDIGIAKILTVCKEYKEYKIGPHFSSLIMRFHFFNLETGNCFFLSESLDVVLDDPLTKMFFLKWITNPAIENAILKHYPILLPSLEEAAWKAEQLKPYQEVLNRQTNLRQKPNESSSFAQKIPKSPLSKISQNIIKPIENDLPSTSKTLNRVSLSQEPTVVSSTQVIRPSLPVQKPMENVLTSTSVPAAIPLENIAILKQRKEQLISQQHETFTNQLHINDNTVEGGVGADSQRTIKFAPFFPERWNKLYDANKRELPPMHVEVVADKGFNYFAQDNCFVNYKKNHFQITVKVVSDPTPSTIQPSMAAASATIAATRPTPHREPRFVGYPINGSVHFAPIDHFLLVFCGIKSETPTSEVPVMQSQNNRKHSDFEPIRFTFDGTLGSVKRIIHRLHFSTTTMNNQRKNGKLHPEQKYFSLVAKIMAISLAVEGPLLVQSFQSERIIVRASNPGQFEQSGPDLSPITTTSFYGNSSLLESESPQSSTNINRPSAAVEAITPVIAANSMPLTKSPNKTPKSIPSNAPTTSSISVSKSKSSQMSSKSHQTTNCPTQPTAATENERLFVQQTTTTMSAAIPRIPISLTTKNCATENTNATPERRTSENIQTEATSNSKMGKKQIGTRKNILLTKRRIVDSSSSFDNDELPSPLSNSNSSNQTDESLGPASKRQRPESPINDQPTSSMASDQQSAPLLGPILPSQSQQPPNSWSLIDRSEYITCFTATTVEYTGKSFGAQKSAAGWVRTNYPIPEGYTFFYFEIKVLNRGHRLGCTGIGLSWGPASLKGPLGYTENTMSYQANGLFYSGTEESGQKYGPEFTDFDTIGCGLDLEKGDLFFTKNGQYLTIAQHGFEVTSPIYPSVSLWSKKESIEANFGTDQVNHPFKFSPESYIHSKNYFAQTVQLLSRSNITPQ